MTELSDFTPLACRDVKYRSSLPRATTNLPRNRFNDSGGKQYEASHKTAVSLIQQRHPVKGLAGVQTGSADTVGFVPLWSLFLLTLPAFLSFLFFSFLLESPTHISSLAPYPWSQCNAAHKAGKNKVSAAFLTL